MVTDVIMSVPQHTVVAGQKVTSDVQLTKTSVNGLRGINDPTVISKKRVALDNSVAPVMAVTEEAHPADQYSSGTSRDYLAIIATPQFYIQAWTQNGTSVSTGWARITGYRAKANADLYAALVTEELNF